AEAVIAVWPAPVSAAPLSVQPDAKTARAQRPARSGAERWDLERRERRERFNDLALTLNRQSKRTDDGAIGVSQRLVRHSNDAKGESAGR
ncbi:MAG: hypothetical protein ACJAQ3_000727, partial [Planctomycetota bacterium]